MYIDVCVCKDVFVCLLEHEFVYEFSIFVCVYVLYILLVVVFDDVVYFKSTRLSFPLE